MMKMMSEMRINRRVKQEIPKKEPEKKIYHNEELNII